VHVAFATTYRTEPSGQIDERGEVIGDVTATLIRLSQNQATGEPQLGAAKSRTE